MSKDQLETKVQFGLSYLNLGDSTNCLRSNHFKVKEYLKKKEPWWPMFVYALGEPTLDILNLSNCAI